MTVYLHPELPSKAAYKRAIKEGKRIEAVQQTPFGAEKVESGRVTFSGPHFPKPHKYYGTAVVEGGEVKSVK